MELRLGMADNGTRTAFAAAAAGDDETLKQFVLQGGTWAQRLSTALERLESAELGAPDRLVVAVSGGLTDRLDGGDQPVWPIAAELVPGATLAQVSTAEAVVRAQVDPTTSTGPILVCEAHQHAFEANVIEPGLGRDLQPLIIEAASGDQLDWAVAVHVLTAMGFSSDVEPSEALVDRCRSSRQALNHETMISIPIQVREKATAIGMTRSQLLYAIERHVGVAIESVARHLREIGVAEFDLDQIVLVGSGAELPAFAGALRRRFEQPTTDMIDYDAIAARGAALLDGVRVMSATHVPKIQSADRDGERIGWMRRLRKAG